MIARSRQSWIPGETVRVGFMALIVKAAIPTPGDYAPDAYLLANPAGDRLYEFVPHHGLRRIGLEEARELLERARQHAARIAAQATARAHRTAAVHALFTGVAA